LSICHYALIDYDKVFAAGDHTPLHPRPRIRTIGQTAMMQRMEEFAAIQETM